MPTDGITETTQRWANLTGIPLPEASCRVRFLRKAGLMPNGLTFREGIGDGLTSHLIIASMSADRHIDAADALTRYAPLRCINSETSFFGITLSKFMENSLKQSRVATNPWKIVYATFNLSRAVVEILVVDTRRTENIGTVLVFGDLNGPTAPVENVRRLSGRVIEGMGKHA